MRNAYQDGLEVHRGAWRYYKQDMMKHINEEVADYINLIDKRIADSRADELADTFDKQRDNLKVYEPEVSAPTPEDLGMSPSDKRPHGQSFRR